MITSEHHNLFGVFELEGHEQADNFQTVLTLVDVVSEEEVVESMYVALLEWILPDVEESHQVYILSVKISKDLDRWLDIFDNDWLSTYYSVELSSKLNNVFPLARELSTWFDFLTILGLQQ